MKMFAQFSAQLHFHYAARRGSVTWYSFSSSPRPLHTPPSCPPPLSCFFSSLLGFFRFSCLLPFFFFCMSPFAMFFSHWCCCFCFLHSLCSSSQSCALCSLLILNALSDFLFGSCSIQKLGDVAATAAEGEAAAGEEGGRRVKSWDFQNTMGRFVGGREQEMHRQTRVKDKHSGAKLHRPLGQTFWIIWNNYEREQEKNR